MITYLLNSGICLSVLFLFYHFVLRKENMFAFNRYFLLVSLAFSLLVPFISLPSFFPPIISSGQNATIEIREIFINHDIQPSNDKFLVADPVISQPISGFNTMDWYGVLILVYTLGLLFFLVKFIFQILGMAKLIKSGVVIQKEKYKLVLLDQEIMPFTFLNYLFVNQKTYCGPGLEPGILQHELTHIKEKHSIDILLIELLKSVFWFNPIFLFYKRAIQLNHEFLADRVVIEGSNDIIQYQKLLISKVIGNEFVFNLSSPINYSVTKNRLIMMKKTTSKRRSMLLKIVLVPIILLFGAGLSQSEANQNKTSFLPDFMGKDFESYINEALSEESKYILELEKLDIKGAKAAYDQLSQEEKEELTEFPFLEDDVIETFYKLQKAKDSVLIRINFSSPPEKKQIKLDTWQNWLNTKNLEVTVDGNQIERPLLEKFSPGDFALFEVRGIEKKKFLKKEKFRLTLTTHDHYQEKYIFARKKLHTIIAGYPDGNEAEVLYRIKHILLLPSGEFDQYYHENFLNRALESMLTYEFENYPKKNAIVDIRKSFGINVTRNGQKEMVVISNE
ncbi:hypothetical protein MMU07_18340 [Aquiflexum sp. LQ15W]|uniref:M56 family metallopeptidase n=1 Tax=Cognataquiflexum nitidum TaxID=2922272 RepID=UPI001F129EF4|nr:M56 family metallopeptidase [Cognataquiflexum nitidum]MCH6201547.1 hypothetical protein [Cognataquiflexum nitidum]